MKLIDLFASHYKVAMVCGSGLVEKFYTRKFAKCNIKHCTLFATDPEATGFCCKPSILLCNKVDACDFLNYYLKID